MSERNDRPGWQRWDDRDDWFADPGPEQRPDATEEIWLNEERGTPVSRRRPAQVGWRWLALGAAGLLVLLVLVLWAAGVFAGGGTPAPAPATTTRPATTTVRTPAPAPTRTPATTLKPGSGGGEVKRLQRALARLGYSPGNIDGSYGPATVAALKRFQQANRLQPDGVLGPKTLRALKAKLAAS